MWACTGTRLSYASTLSAVENAPMGDDASSPMAPQSFAPPAPLIDGSSGCMVSSSYLSPEQIELKRSIELKRNIAYARKAQKEIDRRVPPLDSYIKTVVADPCHSNSADLQSVATYRRMEEWFMVRAQMREEYKDPFLLFVEPVFEWQSHPFRT